MTARQRALHRRLQASAPWHHTAATHALADRAVGHSVAMRLPASFELDVSTWNPIVTGQTILVTKTPRGLEYVEQVLHRKGWAAPRPRLLPTGTRHGVVSGSRQPPT